MVTDREWTRQKEYQRIADTFKKIGDYKQMYQDYAVVSQDAWDDTERNDYQLDLWYNLNCNEICLEMLGNLCEGKRVLTVGGGFWVEKAMLDHITAQEIIRTDIIADEGVLEEDAQNLSFANSSFDVVICRELIEHVPDEQKVFSEIRRVLRPQGYLLITTPNVFSLAVDGTFHVRGYTPSSFLAELEHQGFTITKKRGNLPYCFHGLKIYSQQGITQALDEYKELDKLTRDYENRYYLGTQLFVLCQRENENGSKENGSLVYGNHERWQ